MSIRSNLFAKVRLVRENLGPRRIAGLVPLPDFCRARGLDFAALATDLFASVGSARFANNPAPLSPDLFG